MAHLETDEGTGEIDVDEDIGAWLKRNRLSKFKDKFVDDEVTVNDILTWNEDTIDAVCKDYAMTKTVIKQRFKTAIRTLQHMSNPSEMSQQIYRVVTSIKESESIKSIEIELSNIQSTIQENQNQSNKSAENCKVLSNKIETIFTSFQSNLNQKKSQMIQELKMECNQHLTQLAQQKKVLLDYEKALQSAKEAANALILDPKMDSSKRENKIIQITGNVVENMEKEIHFKVPDISVNIDIDAVNKYIADIGGFSKQSPAPNMKLTDIWHNAVSVRMECADKTTIVDGVVELQSEHKGDDEKNEWIVYECNKGMKQNEVLKHLRCDNTYNVRGKYRSVNGLWSMYSKVVSFKTLKKQGLDIGVKVEIKHKHKRNKWYDGCIVDVLNSMVKVHFDGFNSKFDEWIKNSDCSTRIRLK